MSEAESGRDAIKEALATGRPAYGLYVHDADMVEVAADVGFDWFMIDQMFTSREWKDVEHLVRVGTASGMAQMVRIQSYPWGGYDHRLVSEAARAVGIGAKYVAVSNANIEEIIECTQTVDDWHAKALHLHPHSSEADWDTREREPAFIIPHPETGEGLGQWRETLSLPNVRILYFPMTDASRALSGDHRPDFYLPELWRMIDEAVEYAEAEGKIIAANTSYAYDIDELLKRANMLVEHGVRLVTLQTFGFLFKVLVAPLMSGLHR